MSDDKKIHEMLEEIEESSVIVTDGLRKINTAVQKINQAFKLFL